MEERWILRGLLVECKRNDQVVVDAEPAPHDSRRFAVHLPGKAKPGLEIFVQRLEKRFDLRIDRLLVITDIEQIRDLIVRILWIRRRLPTQSQVQGEPRAQFEVILHIEPEHGLADALIAFFPERHSAEKLWLSQDEILDVLECVLASTFRLDGVVVLDALEDAAPFEGMPVFHEGQIVSVLPEVVYPEPRERGVGSDLADRRGSTLLAHRQRSHDFSRNKGKFPL